MAVFNPEVQPGQDNSPNYFKYSEPIKQPEADKSTGIALSTIGQGIEGATDLADTTVKQKINEDVRNTVEPIRDDFTKELELARNAQQNGQDLPTAVSTGIGKVQGLQDALAQGKINDTYYDLRLKTAVTNLRSQYPGYVDLIDQKVASITGVNPANAYINNLMQDINRSVSSKKTEADKILDLARDAMTKGLAPGSKEQYQRLLNDPSYAPKFLDWYTRANENKTALETDNLQRANRKASKEESAADDESKFTNLVGRTVQTNLHSAVTIPGTDTPQGIMDFMKAVAAHPEQYSSTAAETLATRLALQKTALQSQLSEMSNQSQVINGVTVPSYAQSIGTEKRDSIIKSQLSVYDSMIDALKNKDFGLAFWHANQAVARLNDRKDNISAGPIGADLDNMQIIQEKAGPGFSQVLIPQLLQSNIDEKMRPYFNSKAVEARAQPDFDKTGKPITMEQHMSQADELQKQGQITAGMKARYFGNLLNIVDDIKNPEVPDNIKSNVVKYIFSPEGQGMLRHINTDYYDPDRKVQVPGKYSAWTRLSSDDIVSNIAKLSKADPSIGQMYKNYMENEAGSQLFYKEFQNLNHFTGHDDLYFKYTAGDDKNLPHIELIDKTGQPATMPTGRIGGSTLGLPTAMPIEARSMPKDQGYLYQVQKIVDRTNQALEGMARVEKGMGGDVNAYVLNFMQHAQVNLGQNWTGLPQKLADAIAASRTPQRRIEDTFSDTKK